MFVPFGDDELTKIIDNDYSYLDKYGDKSIFTYDELLDAIFEYCQGDINQFRVMVYYLLETLTSIETMQP